MYRYVRHMHASCPELSMSRWMSMSMSMSLSPCSQSHTSWPGYSELTHRRPSLWWRPCLPLQPPTPRGSSSFTPAGCFFLILLSFNIIAAAASPPPSFSFDFSNTSSYNINDLDFQGDARPNDGLVDLTCNSKDKARNLNCRGRMSYNHPVPFYDNNTGEATSFTTSFTFVIKPISAVYRGDGMAFFLSGYPSRLPPVSSGGFLGLINSSETTLSGADRFVAVEFDTYANRNWDSRGASDHIGIDLNSVESVNVTTLLKYSLNGTMTATITFDGNTRMLEASLHFDSNHSLDVAQLKWQLPEPLSALLPSEVAVGFSATTGGNFELHQILAWSFNSTMPFKETPAGPNSGKPKQDGQVLRANALIVGGAVVASLALAVAIWSRLSWRRWRRTRDSFGKGSRLRRFEYSDLAIATDRFSKEKKIGAGGFGVVYRGSLKNEQPVAVKKILKDSRGENTDFLAELRAIGRTGHENIVRLEGWCCRIDNWNLLDFICWRQNFKLFLVYELVPNGNLHEHLHERPDILSWTRRNRIVKGIGSALRYLHHECNPYILHRDIKPSNILLDDDFNAKLGDFGLSRIVEANQTSLLTSIAVGTLDYMDPLCKKHGHVKVRQSSDIYSFGIVLLEIAHGENNPDLVRKLHVSQPDTFVEVVADKKLVGQFNKTQMERVIILGLLCSDPDESRRPTMIRAMQFLEYGEELCPATPDTRHIAASIKTSSEQQALIPSSGA